MISLFFSYPGSAFNWHPWERLLLIPIYIVLFVVVVLFPMLIQKVHTMKWLSSFSILNPL